MGSYQSFEDFDNGIELDNWSSSLTEVNQDSEICMKYFVCIIFFIMRKYCD